MPSVSPLQDLLQWILAPVTQQGTPHHSGTSLWILNDFTLHGTTLLRFFLSGHPIFTLGESCLPGTRWNQWILLKPPRISSGFRLAVAPWKSEQRPSRLPGGCV